MFMYSAMKNMAKRIEEYSVWKPPTSSPSASGRSNGARLVSHHGDQVDDERRRQLHRKPQRYAEDSCRLGLLGHDLRCRQRAGIEKTATSARPIATS
jgi:hypothetical protein